MALRRAPPRTPRLSRERPAGRVHPAAAATLSSGGASGSRTALSLSSLMLWRLRRDEAAGEQRSRRSGQLSRARADAARPAPPRLGPPEPRLAGPTAARPPALALGPTQRRGRLPPGRGATAFLPPRPASSFPEGTPALPREASAHAHCRAHSPGDPPMTRLRQGGGAAGAGRSGVGRRALDRNLRGRGKVRVSEEEQPIGAPA